MASEPRWTYTHNEDVHRKGFAVYRTTGTGRNTQSWHVATYQEEGTAKAVADILNALRLDETEYRDQAKWDAEWGKEETS